MNKRNEKNCNRFIKHYITNNTIVYKRIIPNTYIMAIIKRKGDSVEIGILLDNISMFPANEYLSRTGKAR